MQIEQQHSLEAIISTGPRGSTVDPGQRKSTNGKNWSWACEKQTCFVRDNQPAMLGRQLWGIQSKVSEQMLLDVSGKGKKNTKQCMAGSLCIWRLCLRVNLDWLWKEISFMHESKAKTKSHSQQQKVGQRKNENRHRGKNVPAPAHTLRPGEQWHQAQEQQRKSSQQQVFL